MPRLFSSRQRNRVSSPSRKPISLQLEVLEERAVPSIIWDNRGSATDQFTPAERLIVDRAIQLWDARIDLGFDLPISFLGGPNSEVNLGAGTLGLASAQFSSASGGRPTEGTVTITSNAALVQNGSAPWFVDPTPLDNAEYTPSTTVADVFNNGPDQVDLLTTVTHEIGHVLGFGDFFPPLASRLTRIITGERLFTGNDGFTAFFTVRSGGHLSPRVHPSDLMTPVQFTGQRSLPSETDVRILIDAFGYQRANGVVTPGGGGGGTVPETVPGTVGTFDPSTGLWYLRDIGGTGGTVLSPFQYGAPGWGAVTGDWDGDGLDTVGVFDPSTATWYLRNSNTPGAPDFVPFSFGAGNWIPVAGDWNGDGVDTVGVFDPSTATWYLRNSNTQADNSLLAFQYGGSQWRPVVGDWNNDGVDTVGVFDPISGLWYLRNANSPGAPDIAPFLYGLGQWVPVAGNWDNQGGDGIGMVDPFTGTWYIRNSPSSGAPDVPPFAFGGLFWTPLGGIWQPLGGQVSSTQGDADALRQASILGEISDEEDYVSPTHTSTFFCCCPACQGLVP
jgi:hypothetical protein